MHRTHIRFVGGHEKPLAKAAYAHHLERRPESMILLSPPFRPVALARSLRLIVGHHPLPETPASLFLKEETMKRPVFFTLIALVLVGAGPIHTQEVQLPEYTMEQRWNRLADLMVGWETALVTMGREHGMTPEEVGN